MVRDLRTALASSLLFSSLLSSLPAAAQTLEPQLDFNFASWLRKQDNLGTLKGVLVDGDPYLAAGPKQLMQIQVNFTTQHEAEPLGVLIKSELWADAYVFNKRVGNEASQGEVLDIVGRVSTHPVTASLNVRIMGQERFAGKVKLAYNTKLSREIVHAKSAYPVPMLGLYGEARMLGELGIDAQLVQSDQRELALELRPDVIVSGNVSADAKAEGLARARVNASAIELIRASTLNVLAVETAKAPKNAVIPSIIYDQAKLASLSGKLAVEVVVNRDAEALAKKIFKGPSWTQTIDTAEELGWERIVFAVEKPIFQRSLKAYRGAQVYFDDSTLPDRSVEACRAAADAYAASHAGTTDVELATRQAVKRRAVEQSCLYNSNYDMGDFKNWADLPIID